MPGKRITMTSVEPEIGNQEYSDREVTGNESYAAKSIQFFNRSAQLPSPKHAGKRRDEDDYR
jgi:hypothetical protein